MTEQEAIKNIKALNVVCWQKDFYDEEFAIALAMAIKALKKQVAKKPKDNDGYYCPFCDNRVDDDGRGYEQHYCMECGQKLDWSVEE